MNHRDFIKLPCRGLRAKYIPLSIGSMISFLSNKSNIILVS